MHKSAISLYSVAIAKYPAAITKSRLILALFVINLGIFIATAAWLPVKKGGYGYSGAITRFINSRERWDIPCAVALGSSLVSFGAVLLLGKNPKNPDI